MLTADNEELVVHEIRSFISSRKIQIPDNEQIIVDGKIQRFSLIDEDQSKKSGWYVVKNNYLHFGSWKGERYTEKLKYIGDYSSYDNSAFLAENKKMMEQRKLAQQQAALTAWSIWETAQSCFSHPYLVKKNVGSHGVRVSNGNLLVPITNSVGQMTSLQFINQYGNKWFHKGGEIKGNYFTIGELNQTQEIIISEGYSTAATLYEVTKLPQVAAFSAGNLLATAKNIRARFPEVKITIAADNDSNNQSNVGITKGKEAARTVDGQVIFPMFKAGDHGTDFNDYANLYGNEALSKVLPKRGSHDGT